MILLLINDVNVVHLFRIEAYEANHLFFNYITFSVSRQQTEQDLKNFSRDLIFNDSDDTQRVLEEEAKAIAQFNQVCFYHDTFLYTYIYM